MRSDAPSPARDPQPADGIGARLNAIRARIEAGTARAGRPAGSVALVAVSKFQPVASVDAVLAAGQHRFGENRVQEAQNKFPPLRADWPALRLHLIGPLQTNKAADAVAVADTIETLDRPRLADALERAAQQHGRMPALLVQVNIGAEPQKAGVMPAEADGFILDCRRRFAGALVGLMAIPPAGADPEPFFRRMAAMAAHHGLAELSMGMSGDFEAAIRCGATSVRVGSAIFGARPGAGAAVQLASAGS